MKAKMFLKSKQNKAFTMIETLIVLAVIVILLSISIIGLSTLAMNLKMTELDDYAKVIYLEAQNQLSLVEVEGGLGAYHESIREAYPSTNAQEDLRFLKEIYAEGEKPADYPEGADKMWEQMCYLKKNDPLSAKLISYTSDIYNNGGAYLIEFNAQTGDVYGVFYWESNEPIAYEDIMEYDTRTREERKDAIIGYYGGMVSGDLTAGESLGQVVSLVNGEELYLKVSFENTANLMSFYHTGLSISVTITGENGKTVVFEKMDLSNAVVTLDTIEFYMLLDSMQDGLHFDDIVNAGLEDDEKIIPGENLDIRVDSYFAHESGRWETTDSIRGNSLFGFGTDENKICISSVRHMMNLNKQYYDSTEFERDTIQYISDVDFDEKAYAWETDSFGEPLYLGYGNAERPNDSIAPIENDVLFENITINGVHPMAQYVLHNFKVVATKDNAGIFSTIKNVEVSNICVRNLNVEAADYNNVGGLIGYMQGGSIHGCGVYLATSGVVNGVETDYCMMDDTVNECIHSDEMEHRYDTYRVKGKNNVGGLIGYAEGVLDSETIISGAFAAIKAEGSGVNAGGLIGCVKNASGNMNITIENSYASGMVIGNEYAGGLIGEVLAFEHNVLVSGNYATGDVYATKYFGGFVGKSTNASYSDCVSYGKPRNNALTGTNALKAGNCVGGFVYKGTTQEDTYTNCVYMIQNGYNTEPLLENPDVITTKNYTELLSNETVASYPYNGDLFMQTFPFAPLSGQTSHYGDWPNKFVIDTSLVYYERYTDDSYGYYCVTTISDNDNVWILNTLKDEVCVEDGYGLLTKYNLKDISYDLYIGSEGEAISGRNVEVVDWEDVDGETYSEEKFIRLKLQGAVEFYAVEDYDEVYGVEGNKTNESFEISRLYLYQLPYELQCTNRMNVSYFYDRIAFDATVKGGTNKKVIDGLSYLYCPHFAKTAVNPNVVGGQINSVRNPMNIFVRSARQLNALGRYPYYWNVRGGYENAGDSVYIQETDINFSTYVKTYAGHEFDLQAFGKEYSNRPIGNSDYAFLSETNYAGQFMNTYDGRSNQIIDYCVSVSDIQFVGLFGEIRDGGIKNVVMTVSENPASENAGIITSDFKTWMTVGDDSRRREMRASVGALLGMAYDNSYCDVESNVIENCVAAGYTVQYVLTTTANPHTPAGSTPVDPLGISIGGLIGYGESYIKNCAAVNDVVIKLEKDYSNSFSYYYYHYYDRVYKRLNHQNEGGIVNLSGFVGSYLYNKVENCYSGGTIKVIDNGYEIPHLRVGNFCAGWLDTRAYGLDYTDWKKVESGKRVCSCGKWCSGNNKPFHTFEYVNCYTYTTISDSVWDVATKTMSYVPFASQKVDFFHRVTDKYGTRSGYWTIADSIPDKYTTFDNAYYLDVTAEMGQVTDENDMHGSSVTSAELAKNASIKAGATYAYAYTEANKSYPYQAVIYEVDENGNKTDNYVHYGEWLEVEDTSIVYYEKYADDSYGYYCVTNDSISNKTWILDTLKDEVCVEDGYGLLTKHEFDSFRYSLYVGNGSKLKLGTALSASLIPVQENLKFAAYKEYDEALGEASGKTGEYFDVSRLYQYLYKLPYSLQFTDRTSGSSFYDRIIVRASKNGENVINGVSCLYNPHFAKAAINGKGNEAYEEPTNVYVRSARQLNVLSRYPYYWNGENGFADGAKATFIQETDINFSTYVKTYAGEEFDLQAFGKEYSNRPIGEAVYTDVPQTSLSEEEKVVKHFRNIYDGRSNKIIDYCVDGGTDTQYVGLFGAISDATIKNIVMLVSSEPDGNGGVITSRFETKHIWANDLNFDCAGVGALVGLAYNQTNTANTIENCAVSGYTVKYELIQRDYLQEEIGEEDIVPQGGAMEPLAIAIGGLVGFSTSDITNCAAVNDVVIELQKDYHHTHDNYVRDGAFTGGVVYLGGFAGSFSYGKVENCYSGGNINVINNGYSIPKLRVGSFCPGWLNAPISGVSYTDTNQTLEYVNVYSYTKVSENIWDIPGKKVWDEENDRFTDTVTEYFTHYVPLVSTLVDYYDTSVLFNEFWKHDVSVPVSQVTFKNTFYLQELTDFHMEKVLGDDNTLPESFYMGSGENAAASQITMDGLKDYATNNGLTVSVTQGNTHSYVNGDLNANGDLISSVDAYPYPAVIYEVDEHGNKTYVHYGEWVAMPTENSPITRYPVYYEEYEDSYGFLYVDENGESHSDLTTDHTLSIMDTGYGYLTMFEEEANVAGVSIELEDAHGRKTTYYLYKMDQTNLEDTVYKNGGHQSNNYMQFEMTYSKGDVSMGPGYELAVKTGTLCLNPYFGAALCASENLGTQENPLQVRTKEQFENVAGLLSGGAYVKQTHDVDLKYDNIPSTVNRGIYYDGASDEGCVIKHASDTPFARNDGTIANVKVVSFDSTKTSKTTVAGFVLENNGTIEKCSVAAADGEDEVVIQGKNAYGFVMINQEKGLIRDCYVEGKVIATENDACGFVGTNMNEIYDSNVGDNDSNKEMLVQGKNAYGFVAMNHEKGLIDGCYVVGKVAATANDAYGFVGTNEGRINQSSVGVKDSSKETVVQGTNAYGFAGVNQEKAVIEGCYVVSKVIANANIAVGFIGTNNGRIKDAVVYISNNAIVQGSRRYEFVVTNNNVMENCSVMGA